MFNRKSIRLPGFNYSSAGAYFVTLCVRDRLPVFGKVDADGMHESLLGNAAARCWQEIASRFERVSIDCFIVMPDHVHGIIFLDEPEDESDVHRYQHVTPNSIATIVQSYKTRVTWNAKYITGNRLQWQRNYFERVIRDERELAATRSYIENNPMRWWEKHRGQHGD